MIRIRMRIQMRIRMRIWLLGYTMQYLTSLDRRIWYDLCYWYGEFVMVYHSILNKLQRRRRSTSLNVVLLCIVCKYIHELNQNYHHCLLLATTNEASILVTSSWHTSSSSIRSTTTITATTRTKVVVWLIVVFVCPLCFAILLLLLTTTTRFEIVTTSVLLLLLLLLNLICSNTLSVPVSSPVCFLLSAFVLLFYVLILVLLFQPLVFIVVDLPHKNKEWWSPVASVWKYLSIHLFSVSNKIFLSLFICHSDLVLFSSSSYLLLPDLIAPLS